jgi:hypothetical protein
LDRLKIELADKAQEITAAAEIFEATLTVSLLFSELTPFEDGLETTRRPLRPVGRCKIAFDKKCCKESIWVRRSGG